MGQRKCLNEKRLTKKQVRELVAKGGWLHEEYTRFFNYPYASTLLQNRDLIYELSEGRFLYVFDEHGVLLPGKGDIYSADYFLKLIDWCRRVREDSANNRGSSVDYWRFYSKCPLDFPQHIALLENELATVLGLDRSLLDGSYASLDAVSRACEAYGLDKVLTTLYDHLVAYAGEVIRLRVNGFWEMNTTHAGGAYPFVSIGFTSVQYMPINAVYVATNAIEQTIELRKEVANEIRACAHRVKYARNEQANNQNQKR